MRKKKGFTLIEVLVATLVFSITFAVSCTTYFNALKQEEKQRVYLNFESICLDIDEYSDLYQRDWTKQYFNLDYKDLNEFNLYFDKDINQCEESNASYILNAVYLDQTVYPEEDVNLNEMIINIKDIENDRYVIKDLVYGSRGGRYEKK